MNQDCFCYSSKSDFGEILLPQKTNTQEAIPSVV